MNKNFFGGFKKTLDTNAPTLATFGSILGLGLTIFFMHKASKSAAKVEEKYEEYVKGLENDAVDGFGEPIAEDDIKDEKSRLKMDKTLRLIYIYRWALLSGIGSAGFAILSNYLNGRTIATIGSLLALNQKRLKEYAKKGKELIGEEKFKELQDNVEKELFADKLMSGNVKTEKAKVEVNGSDDPEPGFVRYYDTYWGEMYDIPQGRLKDAIAEAERYEYLNWNDWRGMLGIDSCQAGYKIMWDKKNPFKAHEGYVNVGIGGMKAICYDNQPDYDNMGK